MAIKTRAELEAYFTTGAVPTQSQFVDLIDSLCLVSGNDNLIADSIKITTVSAVNIYGTLHGNASTADVATSASHAVLADTAINSSFATSAGNTVTAATANALNTANDYQINRLRINANSDPVNTKLYVVASGTMNGINVNLTPGNTSGCFNGNRSDAGVATYYQCGQVTVGTVAMTSSTCSYNNLSDYRVKENLRPVDSPLDRLMRLPVYHYTYKGKIIEAEGVLAHEAQAVAPYAVTGEKDAEAMQQVDYSKLVPLLIGAVQELVRKCR